MNRSRSPFRRPLRWLLVAALGSSSAQALAQSAGPPCPEQPPLQNWTGSGTVTCPCFAAGEEAGAVLNAPAAHYPIEILRIGIGWGSQFGGAPQSLESELRIYPSGLPNPGAPIFSLPGPVLTDGAINEFDIEPLPGQVILNGGPFTVTLKFANSNNGDIFAPSMVHDGNGCQANKNVIFAIPGGWLNACSAGVTGDWQVHVIYRQVNCGGSGGTYCISAPNSTGTGSIIGHLGTTSISANDLILTAIELPVNQLGIFYYGPNQTQVPFGNGFRCVSGATSRLYPPVHIDVFGNTFRAIDYTVPPASAGVGKIDPGDTWNFQFWYRDPAAGGAGFNFSNGLSLVFVP